MFEFNFKTRDEYLHQRKVWFFLYKDQAKKIRAAKAAYKEAQRQCAPVYSAMDLIQKTRLEMQALLKIRSDARVEAGRQYNTQKIA
jgi:hypothetical protein